MHLGSLVRAVGCLLARRVHGDAATSVAHGFDAFRRVPRDVDASRRSAAARVAAGADAVPAVADEAPARRLAEGEEHEEHEEEHSRAPAP